MAYRSCDYACKFIANKKHHCDYFSHQLCQDSGKHSSPLILFNLSLGPGPTDRSDLSPGPGPSDRFLGKNLVGSGKMCNFAGVISNSKESMTRQLRQQSATGIHHVMLRGINRQTMFEDDDDFRKSCLSLRTWFSLMISSGGRCLLVVQSILIA